VSAILKTKMSSDFLSISDEDESLSFESSEDAGETR